MKVFFPFSRHLKSLMPKSLFARAMMILVLPMILLQLVVVVVFYERHWDSVVRNISLVTARNVEFVVNEYVQKRETASVEQALSEAKRIGYALSIDIKLVQNSNIVIVTGKGKKHYKPLYRELYRTLSHPFMIADQGDDHVRVTIALDDGMMMLTLLKKRVASATTYLFIFWMAGAALLLTVVATLFLRSQIRPIVQLARAAEQFGLGRDVAHFSPRGANEVRRAGRAFLEMAERIKRQVQSRTEMLAGISHDLRTPLTRMTLEVEMADLNDKRKQALMDDIKEMRHMVDEYLDFARTDQEEQVEEFELEAELSAIARNYHRQHALLDYQPSKPLKLTLKRQALLRALQNLIDNALRYGKRAELSYLVRDGRLLLEVRDYGSGIAEEKMQEVFRPFTRLEGSRNTKTGGAGLGLAIARDAAQRLGGDITLYNVYDDVGAVQGLRAVIDIPL